MTSVCFDALPDHSRHCEYAFARTVRANYSREQFARIIRVSVKRPSFSHLVADRESRQLKRHVADVAAALLNSGAALPTPETAL